VLAGPQAPAWPAHGNSGNGADKGQGALGNGCAAKPGKASGVANLFLLLK